MASQLESGVDVDPVRESFRQPEPNFFSEVSGNVPAHRESVTYRYINLYSSFILFMYLISFSVSLSLYIKTSNDILRIEDYVNKSMTWIGLRLDSIQMNTDFLKYDPTIQSMIQDLADIKAILVKLQN